MEPFALYHFPHKAKQHCDALQAKYPRHFKLVQMALQTDTLMVLQGTLPVPYKTDTYNIPMEWVLPLAYPNVPPTCRVVPTKTMCIQPSSHVNTDGLVTLPSDTPDLVSVAQLLIRLFQKRMPVYAAPVGPNIEPVAVRALDPLEKDKRQLEAQLLPLLRNYEHDLQRQLDTLNHTLSTCHNRQHALKQTIRSMNTIRDQQSVQLSTYHTSIERLHEIRHMPVEEPYVVDKEAEKKALGMAIQDTLDHLEVKLEEHEVSTELWLKMVGQMGRQLFFSKWSG